MVYQGWLIVIVLCLRLAKFFAQTSMPFDSVHVDVWMQVGGCATEFGSAPHNGDGCTRGRTVRHKIADGHFVANIVA